MRVFVTGGTGYLGDRIARQLLDDNHEVVALARIPRKASALVGLGARVVQGDIRQKDDWLGALGECEALIHGAGLVSAWGSSPEQFDAVNINGTELLLQAARDAGIERLVVTGSLFALGPSTPAALRDEGVLALHPNPVNQANDYVRSKSLSSRRLFHMQQDGNPVIQVFPTILAGPGIQTEGNSVAGMITKLHRGKIPGLVGSGEQVWNLVGVEDAARGTIHALERGTPGSNYILGGENWTQRRFFSFLARELDRKAPGRALGRKLPLALASVAETWARLFGTTPFLTRGEVLLSHESWMFTSDKAKQELDYHPSSVADVLRETVAWLRDEIWVRDHD